MLIFLVVLLTLLVAVLSFATYNLLKKNEELEDAINEFYGRTNATVRLMRHLDNRQIFEQDDEVGSVFKQLVECVDLLYAFVTETRNGDNNPSEEEER
jgi:flagellar basal body-associated protein FliL